MNKTVYLNFNDLSEETKQYLISEAEKEIREDEAEMAEIREMYYNDNIDEIVTERAERRIYEYDYIFNV